jgi:nitrile hydratase accessory protein
MSGDAESDLASSDLHDSALDDSNFDNSEFDKLLLDARLSPPMANGEATFDAPWQGRVFGMARTLAEQGHYSWDEFRVHLIAHIGDWDRTEAATDYHYYDHFLAALQTLLVEKGMLDEHSVEGRFKEFAARPHGHDH